MDKVNKEYLKLDGDIKEEIEAMKEYFGLRPEQSFADIEVDDEEEE